MVLFASLPNEVIRVRYTREDGCRAWLTHGLIQADTLNALLLEHGSAEAIYDRFVAEGSAFLRPKVTEFGITQLAQQAERARMHDMLVTMRRYGIGVLTQQDALYPDSLLNMQSPPALLFFRGDLDCLMGKCIAVVGSRKASPKGIEVTQNICRELSLAGVTIVSGLAVGIDTAAHEGCLRGTSPTAAVMSTGLDVDYPIDNARLKDEIVSHGGVLLSECPPGMRANRYVFQVRNRIIAGLGKALLMMESQIRSGSTLTVHHALDQGKEVYAYPGIPGTEWAAGAHQLLREGANYFTSAQDILEDLGWNDASARTVTEQKKELPPLSDEQRRVYALLGQGDRSFDQLAAESALDVPVLTVALTMLQMMGLIKALPGKVFCRI